MELRMLNPSDEQTFRDAVAEFKEHDPDWEFAFNLADASNFSDYTTHLKNQSEGRDIRGFVPNSYMGVFVDGKCVGRSSIRHELNDQLLSFGGHIGYGVVPSERRKGYGREILRLSLAFLRSRGVKKALLTCDDHNLASIRIIEIHGGVLENKVPRDGTKVLTRRYWIDLT
jgi:predicted acetyltransferase